MLEDSVCLLKSPVLKDMDKAVVVVFSGFFSICNHTSRYSKRKEIHPLNEVHHGGWEGGALCVKVGSSLCHRTVATLGRGGLFCSERLCSAAIAAIRWSLSS